MSHFLYSPLTWGLLLAVLMVWRWSRMAWVARVLSIACGIVLFLLCTPLGANLLVAGIQGLAGNGVQGTGLTKGDSSCPLHGDTPVVLLSGGFEGPPSAVDDYASLHVQSWKRMRGATQWLKKHPGHALWISGGGPYPIKEADVLGRLALDWGVPATQLQIESRSTNTWNSASTLRAALPREVLLATSALHMPRALIAYQRAGYLPCPLPTDSQYVPSRSLLALVPQTSAMYKTEEATYELAGIVMYLLRPSPALGRASADGPTG